MLKDDLGKLPAHTKTYYDTQSCTWCTRAASFHWLVHHLPVTSAVALSMIQPLKPQNGQFIHLACLNHIPKPFADWFSNYSNYSYMMLYGYSQRIYTGKTVRPWSWSTFPRSSTPGSPPIGGLFQGAPIRSAWEGRGWKSPEVAHA